MEEHDDEEHDDDDEDLGLGIRGSRAADRRIGGAGGGRCGNYLYNYTS